MNYVSLNEHIVRAIKDRPGEWLFPNQIAFYARKSTGRTVGMLLRYLVDEVPGLEKGKKYGKVCYRYTEAAA